MKTPNDSSGGLVLDEHEDFDWKELPDWVREAAEGLGYTKKLWDKDKEPEVCELDWEELTTAQQESATRLGYTKKLWDEDDDESEDESEEEKDEDTGQEKTADAEPILVLDQHEDSDWQELPEWVREAAKELGYTKKLWNKDQEPEICELDWMDLTDAQRDAAKILGYTSATWDDDESDSSTCNARAALVLDQHEDDEWDELPQWVQEAAKEIGYTKKLWDKDKEPKFCELDWEELTSSQQEAATRLGYTQVVWDNDDGSVSSDEFVAPQIQSRSVRLEDVHKHTKWTIYCIQLYTETKDYKFKMKEGMGLSMYANRPLEANEFIIRSPVGPNIHEGLFEASPDGILSEERRGFAERFLEWHHTHGKTNRVGAQNAEVAIKLEDFSNPSTTSQEHRSMPRPDFPVYDLEIFEHEMVIAEFIPSPDNPDHELPPDRRFDVLHYDEGLPGLDGEEGYSPEIMKRPPTLCGMENRSLELPGHFSNHASGATSTCYDFMRLGHTDAAFDPSSSLELDLPEWMRNEMANKMKKGEIVEHSHMTARMAMEVGTEITTDYSRWHWSNADMTYHSESRVTPVGYFLGTEGHARSVRWDWDDLSPKIQRAARILGYTQELWEAEEIPPSFGKSWCELTLQEQEAANNLTGRVKGSWYGSRPQDGGCDDDDDDDDESISDLSWSELTEDQKQAVVALGLTEESWRDDDFDLSDAIGEDLYWYNLRPEVRDALVVLGHTEVTWEEDDECDGEYGDSEPWFECLCGDTHCHSSKEKGGFRGVKYFPLEEQLKVAPLLEPWVQQQLQWSLYQRKIQQEQQEYYEEKKMDGLK